MANDPYDLSTVQHVLPGYPVSGPVSSQPTRALELRLRSLEALVQELLDQQTTGQGASIIRGVKLGTTVAGDSAVALYNVVYYDNSTGTYLPAVAGLTFQGGSYQPNAAALALGVCITVNADNTGDVMVAGYHDWNDDIRAQMLMDKEIFTAGVPYYLTDDPLQAGRITQYPPSLRVRVLLGTYEDFILQPEYGSTETMESVQRIPIGARAVGSVRVDQATGTAARIVGFDALENYAPNAWRLTNQSTVPDLQSFGWLVADISVMQLPAAPIWIKVEVAAGGIMSVYSANSLAELTTSTDPGTFNLVNYSALAPGSEISIRAYTVKSRDDVQLGTLQFSFVNADTILPRFCVLQFPTSFQGWKMVNPPVTPQLTVVVDTKGGTVTSGPITGVTVIEGGSGYATPPQVVFTDPTHGGSGATAIAVLNSTGSVVRIDVTAGGTGYATSTVATLEMSVNTLPVLNGGQGAQLSVQSSGGAVTGITVVNGGSGYWTPPAVIINDPASGQGATAVAEVDSNGVLLRVTVSNPGVNYTAPVALVVLANNYGYWKATPPVLNYVLGTGGVITGVGVPNGGAGILANSTVTFTSASGNGATGIARTDPTTGAILGINITAGGTAYGLPITAQFITMGPLLELVGGSPTTGSEAAGTLTLTENSVGAVDLRCRGTGYVPGATVVFEAAALASGGTPAQATATLNGSGGVDSINLINPGSGYKYPPAITLGNSVSGYGFKAVALLTASVTGATVTSGGRNYQYMPTARAAVPLKTISMTNNGSGYARSTVALVSGGSALPGTTIIPAIVDPVVSTIVGPTFGTVTSVNVISGGYNYATPPVVTFYGAYVDRLNPPTATLTLGTGDKASQVVSAAVGNNGTSGCVPAPICTIAAPEIVGYGNKANGIARVGGWVRSVKILDPGYRQHPTQASSVPKIVLVNDRYGYGAEIRALFHPMDGTANEGALEYVEIIDPGAGFDPNAALTWDYSSGDVTLDNGGRKAQLGIYLEGSDGVARVDVGDHGWGYGVAPVVTIAPPTSGSQATAIADLWGVGAQVSVDLYGWGGPTLTLPTPTGRNALQINNWAADSALLSGISKPKPQAVFYYNFLADPLSLQKYPPLPLDKATFSLNGTELYLTAVPDGINFSDPSADIGVSPLTLLWPTVNPMGCPWDAQFQPMTFAAGMGGVDCLIPGTGLPGDDSTWWRWQTNVYGLQPIVNRSWLNSNRTSRFYLSGRVSGLAVVPPLQLVDLLTGEVLPSDGSPQTGVLGLQQNSQTNVLLGSPILVDLAAPNLLQVIYTNTTSRRVYVSAFLMVVMFQTNRPGGLAPTVASSAKITIGTQAGNYRDMVGNYDTTQPDNSAPSSTLYAAGQVKEIVPDTNFPSVLVNQGQSVYLRVVTPAGDPIQQQTVSIQPNGYFV